MRYVINSPNFKEVYKLCLDFLFPLLTAPLFVGPSDFLAYGHFIWRLLESACVQ